MKKQEKIKSQEEDSRRESGMPGGGAGRKDEVGHSGVYPMSGPHPAGNAEIRGQASWGQGERGAAGYEDHGSSALTYEGGQVLGGYSSTDDISAQLVQVSISETTLEGNLSIPKSAKGVVLFAHGSGSSRHSPRNQRVAHALQQAGLATLLIDLLTAGEESIDEQTAELRFNIEFLARRLVGATDWLLQYSVTKGLSIGYFGASTGAAAALVAAAKRPAIGAIVSRGGRPDLAGPALERVKAPTLLIVGGDDLPVIELNQEALIQLQGEKQLEIVPGASHLFEEPGTLDKVARLASHWFVKWLDHRPRQFEAA